MRTLCLAGWLTPRAGLACVRVGPIDSADTGLAPFAPLKPITKRASTVGQGTVVATVTVFECAAVHPSHFMREVPRRQRPPKFLIKQHRGITAIADHYAAQRPEVIMARSGFWCVIDPPLIASPGLDAVSAAWNTLLRSHAASTPPNVAMLS
jgi:hypothetical protein